LRNLGRLLGRLGPGRLVLLLLVGLTAFATYRLATYGWLADEEPGAIAAPQPTIITPDAATAIPTAIPAARAAPTPAPAAITASPAEPIDSGVALRPTTAVMVPSPTASATAAPTAALAENATATPTPPLLPSPVPTATATATPAPLPAGLTPVPTPAVTPNPVNGWVAAAIPARGISADQLPVDIDDQYSVGENVYVATEFRDVPSGATVGIAWYRDGVEVSVWESGPQFGFERANFAFFRVVSIAGEHTVSILINGQAVAEARFTVSE
jgi:hypothetical protein